MENEPRITRSRSAVKTKTATTLPIESCHVEEREPVVPTITAGSTCTTAHSKQSSRSNSSARGSVVSQRRLLEARAARLSAELGIKKQTATAAAEQARLAAEEILIEAQLNEELAMLEGSQASSCRRSNRVKEWVDKSINESRCQAEPNIKDLARAVTTNINNSDKLLGRLSAKDLPIFSGDPLDWLRFRNSYVTTTKVGQYTEQENVSRLQHCLRGDAWEAVAARLIATQSATDVMKILQMRFGRPDLVLAKLIHEMKRVPKLTGVHSEVILLATKVDNCTAAIESTGHTGYLYSPELMSEIISKLTEPIFYKWLDYSRDLSTQDPQLPTMAKFLMSMAEDICRRGAIETPNKLKPMTYFKRPILLTNAGEESPTISTSGKTTIEKKHSCAYCAVTTHALNNCPTFKELNVNKRWEWICERKLCFRCLRSTHRRDRCKSRSKCTTCKGYHHSLLHRDDWDKNRVEPTEIAAKIWSSENMKVLLKVIPVELQGPKGTLKTYALLDEGSTVTLIERHLAEKLGVSGPERVLNIQGVVGQGKGVSSQTVSLAIKTIEGNYMQLQRIRTIDKMSLTVHTISKQHINKYNHLKGIPLDDFEGQPTMLIGQDNWSLIVSRKIKEGRKNEPVASLTMLGWVLHGFSSSISQNLHPELNYHVRQNGDLDEMNEMIKNYFHYDSLGVKYSENFRYTSDERRALYILDTKSKLIDNNHWEAGLLWRSDDVSFPDNRRNAHMRLRVIEKMMDDDVSFATDYTKQINNMLDKGYATEVKEEPCGRVWYLPHFGVRNPNKPGKLRLVFDAKAETKGISLNTELLSGPDLLNNLFGVLLRFREKKIAVTADIREMFLQIKIIAEDQNAQCFLWRGTERKERPLIYKMTSMTFGATSSPCTATYIIRRNADRFALTHPRAVEAIKRRHYVDDYLDSLDDEEEMKQLVKDVTMIHKAGGFDIRSWVSNEPNVLAKPTSENDSIKLLDENENQRTLGLIWRPSSDTMGFDLSFKKIDNDTIKGIKPPTKREILKVTMSVFDPLGMLCPLLIRSKIMLQEIWRSNLNWDQPIDEKLMPSWRKWLKDLIKCQSFSIPRHYGLNAAKEFQLHLFVDASEQAYAAVAYLRQDEKVIFVAGKSRVAPLKPSSTIPRLELQAALMGARLACTIKKEHSIHIAKCYYWTDSRTVWCWILNNPRQRQVFISNRLAEIDEMTKPDEWRWLPGSLNPADAATRSTEHFEPQWISGPDFLRQQDNMWPTLQPENEEETEPPSQVFVTTDEKYHFIDCTRFSSFRKMLRSLARALDFIDKCRKQHLPLLDHEHKAYTLLMKQSQMVSFGEDIMLIRNGQQIKANSKLNQLNPIIDKDGLLRAKTRLEAGRDLPNSLRRPIILDARNNITILMIESKHRQLGHYGTATLLNELRQVYYIFRLRTAVRTLISKCVLCKIRRGRCEQPMMAGLPAMRLEHHCRPFTFCGVDLFGPMTVTIGRRHEKRWAALFTCFSTRAVHIELVSTLNTDSTIMALRRFGARRGYPRQIHSDNGSNFRSADKELTAALKDERLVEKAADIGIKWTYNPPSAPHMGGVWERLVRSIKTALAAILNCQHPKEEILITLLAEAENIVNSRPLTHVSLDPNNDEALTPNHFLLGSSNGLSAPGNFNEDSMNLRKQWRVTQRLADYFWNRWVREYLPSLRTRGKWTKPSDNLKIGDIVVIADGTLPRNTWPRGQIGQVIKGRDGYVRAVDVITAGGLLRRPATKIVRLCEGAAPSSEEENVPDSFEYDKE